MSLCTGQSRNIDFEFTSNGGLLIPGQYIDGEGLFSNFGFTISVSGQGTVPTGIYAGNDRRVMIFDSSSATYAGPDPDLINIPAGEGNILIVSENNQGPFQGQTENDLNDSVNGYTMQFDFVSLIELTSITLIDVSGGGTLNTYADSAGVTLISSITIPIIPDNTFQTITIANSPLIARMDLIIPNAGGLARFEYNECGTCSVGQVPDCAGNCSSTLPINVPACNVCHTVGLSAPNLCDCAGNCYDASLNPTNVPDCLGICNGTNVADCNGDCNGDKVIDCAGNCGGDAYIDCGGNCISCNSYTCTGSGTTLVIAENRDENVDGTGVCRIMRQEQNLLTCINESMLQIFLSRDSGNTLLPYFDELAILEITSPTNVTTGLNIVRWENDCANPAYPTVTLTGSFLPTSPGNIDITSMFNGEYGDFLITMSVWNKFGPSAWSSAYITPVCAGICANSLSIPKAVRTKQKRERRKIKVKNVLDYSNQIAVSGVNKSMKNKMK